MSPENPGYEKRDVKVGKILLVGVTLTVVFVVSVWVIWLVYEETHVAMFNQEVVQPTLDSLKQARELEREPLYQYHLLDSQAGIYRIPVDSAMKRLAEEADSNTGILPGNEFPGHHPSIH